MPKNNNKKGFLSFLNNIIHYRVSDKKVQGDSEQKPENQHNSEDAAEKP